MEDRAEVFHQLIQRAARSAGGTLDEFQPELDLAACGIDTSIRLSAFFGNLCEGLVRAIPGFSPKAYGAAFDDVAPATTLGSLMELLITADANPRGVPKPEAAAPAPAAQPAAAAAPGGVLSKFKGLFGGHR